MARLRENTSIAAKALTLVILTAARTGEVLKAPFTEFDLKAGVWTVPANRMKAGKEHKIPLTPAPSRSSRRWPRSNCANSCFLG